MTVAWSHEALHHHMITQSPDPHYRHPPEFSCLVSSICGGLVAERGVAVFLAPPLAALVTSCLALRMVEMTLWEW